MSQCQEVNENLTPLPVDLATEFEKQPNKQVNKTNKKVYITKCIFLLY